VAVVKGLSVMHKSGNLAVELLPQEYRERKNRQLHKRALVYFVTLLILNGAIIANIVFMKVKAQDTYLRILTKEIAAIEKDAQAVQKKMRTSQILLESSASGKLMLGLLSELYRVCAWMGLY